MGSFCEIVMSFPLRSDVSDEVLAAFASIAVPSDEAPPLPSPVVESDPMWEIGFPDTDMSDPWSHDWGFWLGMSSTTSYIPSDQGATMVWRSRRWVVTARATWQSTAEMFMDSLAPLGTVIDAEHTPRYDERLGADEYTTGLFVGYARHEAEPRPWLLWAKNGEFFAEDLNPPDFWF